MQVFWFLPTHGECRHSGTTEGAHGRQAAVFERAAAASAGLLRRLVGGGARTRGRPGRHQPGGEPPEEVARKIADVKARAAQRGRRVKFGIRLHVIVRETEDEAYRFAEPVFPLLPARQRAGHDDPVGLPDGSIGGPFGKVVANLDAPSRLVSQS